MKIKSLVLLVAVMSSSALLSSCQKTDTTPPATPTCTPPAKPMDIFKLNLAGSASHIQVLSNGTYSALTAANVTVTAYVLTAQGNLYTVAGGTSQTDLDGQANYVFTAPSRLKTEDVQNILVQFTSTPVTGGDLYQATTVVGNSDILNLVNFSWTSVPATFDSTPAVCAWSGSDTYTITYTQNIELVLAPKAAHRESLQKKLFDLRKQSSANQNH